MMWPYTEEEADYYNNQNTQETNTDKTFMNLLWPVQAPDWDYDTYGHGA